MSVSCIMYCAALAACLLPTCAEFRVLGRVRRLDMFLNRNTTNEQSCSADKAECDRAQHAFLSKMCSLQAVLCLCAKTLRRLREKSAKAQRARRNIRKKSAHARRTRTPVLVPFGALQKKTTVLLLMLWLARLVGDRPDERVLGVTDDQQGGEAVAVVVHLFLPLKAPAPEAPAAAGLATCLASAWVLPFFQRAGY